jgi:hypothetical protein
LGYDGRADGHEIIRPNVFSRVEQTNELPAGGVQPGQVGSLLGIAEWARERQVIQAVRTLVLSRDDVVER